MLFFHFTQEEIIIKLQGSELTRLIYLMNGVNLNWLTQSTGLRNPSLYELYGNNGRTDAYQTCCKSRCEPREKQDK